MPETRIEKTRSRLVNVYGVGILIFSAIVGFITLFAKLLANLKLS